MFYCDPCAKARGWPHPTLFRSRGKCETCGQGAVCNDHPSKDLPAPKRPMVSGSGTWHSTGYRTEDGHAKEDCPGAICPVIEAGYDTLDEPDPIERRPHGFDAALLKAYRAGRLDEAGLDLERMSHVSRCGATITREMSREDIREAVAANGCPCPDGCSASEYSRFDRIDEEQIHADFVERRRTLW